MFGHPRGWAAIYFDSMTFKSLIKSAANAPLSADELEEFNSLENGFDAALGIRYTHISASGVRAEVHVTGAHLQPMGLVHGGVYCSIAESVGSVAGVCAAGGPVVGVNNNTDLIHSVGAGVIEAEASPVHIGRSTQIWEIKLTHRGHLVARTTLRTLVLDKPAE